MKTINIDVPEGFVIDIENSDLKAGKVVLKRIKEELDWSEFGKVSGWYISSDMELCQATLAKPDEYSKDIYPTRRLAEASLALCQLLQWRNKVWLEDGDWTPDWENHSEKYCIEVYLCKIRATSWSGYSKVLSFRTPEIRDKFLRQHRELIEKAKELL